MSKERIEQKLNEWIENKQFINVPELFDLAPEIKCFVVITYKGTGKTKSCLNYVVKNLTKKNWDFAWIRNTDIEFRMSKVADSFRYALIENDLDDKFKVRSDGIYEVIDKDDKFDKGVLRVLFSTMNKAFNTASQNAIEHCKLIVYDEVINPDFHKPWLARDFNNLVRTIQRKSNAKICIFGNAHESSNDLISALGIEFKGFETGKTEVIYRQEQGLCAIYLEKYYIKGISETDKETDKLFMYSEEVKNFNEGKVANNNLYGVKNKLMIPYFSERFSPMWIYDIKDGDKRISFAVGTIENKEGCENIDYLYVEQLPFDKYVGLPRICYRPQDKSESNYYVYDLKDMTTIKTLINYYNAGKLKFETTYARNYFSTYLLSYLKLFLQDE